MNQRSLYQEAIDRIDRLVTRRHAEGLGPGLSLAITARDELLATRSYGVAHADTGEAVTDETLFQIGSITKHFTAVACMRLFEQGRLDPQTPVTQYLDWFAVTSRFETPVTLHHLLTHTAGLVMMIDSYPSSWWQVWVLRNTELGFEPGTKFSYSNVGYNVLQCVIQTITGQSFDRSLRSLIFEPLGMRDTFGQITNRLYPRMAKGHKYTMHDDRPVPKPEKQAVVNWSEMSQGCGSVVTTPKDLARFLRMLLNNGRADDGTAFLSQETYDLMTHPHAVMDGFFPGTTQGYGVLIEQSDETGNKRRILGGGENLGFEAAMVGDLDSGVGIILCNNSFDICWNEVRYGMSALVATSQRAELPPLPEPAPAEPASLGDKAREYVGTYRSPDTAFTIEEEEGGLVLATEEARGKLTPLWGENFIVSHPGFDHAMLTFGRNEAGQVAEAFQLGEEYRNEHNDGSRSFDIPNAWHAYVGQYRSFGILVTNFRIFIRKGQLVCQSFGGTVDQVLTDLGNGAFRSGDKDSPERLLFDCFANGKALRCRASGGDFYRIE